MRERGSATIELTWLVVLLLVPFVYAVVAVFDTQRTAYAATTASAAATRAFVQASDEPTAHRLAQRAVEVTWRDFHAGERPQVELLCIPACFEPGGRVEVVVTTRQSLPWVPDAWGSSLAGIDISSTHAEPFGAYRGAP
ncbi:hypothetical protein BHE97_12395 [Aeromicrobium sp. PE09-221]|uniref:hypothetical protein n=1 Tax=Aeromicrobium sp. PE09-221 TaxID=1898043 RepID=UPI000B3ED13D|nr:hypothetical protein [Aeromicrobium sp. PE09-221]OUZ08919.1 hypothetical protein BHE97_12395 [Aeromicrobium sp. PE09-221]